MSEEPIDVFPDTNSPFREPSVRVVLLMLFASCMLFSLFGVALYQMMVLLFGWNMDLLSGGLPADADAGMRWQMRALLAINHLTMFILAGGLVVWWLYRQYRPDGWLGYLRAARWPGSRKLIEGVVLMLVATPFVFWVYSWNKALPLPEFMRTAENQTTEVLKALLKMDTPLEFLANLTLIAIIPSIGEELVFRGILQQQLMRRMSPWVALLLASAIFSFIHLQFEGFFPRMLLGLMLGFLYWQTQRFWVPAIAHFFNNGLQITVQYLYGQQMASVNLEDDVQVPWIAAVLSLMLTVALAWRMMNKVIRDA
jgi:uncharacterized protein